MVTPNPFNAGEPAPVHSGAGVVTLVDGTTFCISTGSGDITPGGAHGLFFNDARVLSRWQLRVDGQPPQPLSVLSPEAYAARFVLRRSPSPGLADSTLLIVRARVIGDGLRETITLRNVGREPTAVTVTIHVDADFADLFTVKEGRYATGGAIAAIAGADLVLHSVLDGSRGLHVYAADEQISAPGAISWHIVVPAHDEWSTEVMALPIIGNRRIEPRFRDWAARGIATADPLSAGSKLRPWRQRVTHLGSDDAALNRVLRRSKADLGALRITDRAAGRTFVAAGAPWFMTLFGRDSLFTAWMTLPLDVGLAVGTLGTLAALQGTKVDTVNEEEPGRILHELRRGPDSTQVLGGTYYYGSADATPLLVMLLAEAWRWGADEQAIRALLPAADAALDWVRDYGDRDGDGFVEYRRHTDRGLINQGWKDSFDGINDAAGHLAEPPVALVEVQGYVYAALLARAELADAFGQPEVATTRRAEAALLKERFAEFFWLPGLDWFAVALDGHKRPLDALTSNMGHCLWTGIVSDEHAAAVVERFADESMDSGFGLRTLGTTMGAYNPMSYHNGSIWPHDTALAVAGLLRYGHLPGAVPLAHRFIDGLLDAANAYGGRLPELYCGFPRTEFERPVPYPTSCSPQAWSAAAPLLLVRAALGLEPDVPARRLRLRPHVPTRWGTITVDGLRLGHSSVRITANGTSASVTGLPDGWAVDIDGGPPQT